jgi:uncharacterized membrane protein YdcZ (DUF606 family)
MKIPTSVINITKGTLVSLSVLFVFGVSLMGIFVVIMYSFIEHEKSIKNNNYDGWWWLVIGGFLGEIIFKT